MQIEIIGIRGDTPFDKIVAHFTELGGDVVLLNPEMVCGKTHIQSAAMHAERAFENGHHRSKTILTETILYAAGERQIGNALKKMRPEDGRGEYIACLFNIDDPKLEKICMSRDDTLCDASYTKAENLGLIIVDGIPADELALEMVAMTDLLKQ